MSDEDWVKAAMTDDSMVVELLFCLNHAAPTKPALPLDCSVRQRCSKTVLQAKKPTPRASPTTPLSWSGGATSASGGGVGADGFEESSRPPPKRSEASRSKVIGTSETTTTKRLRKKKTLPELKEEETLLLKERRLLKRELATLRVTLEKQRARNESLKKMKLGLQSQPAAEEVTKISCEEALSNQTQQKVAACDPVPSTLPPTVRGDNFDSLSQPSPINSSCFEAQKEVTDQNTKFVLPDLNLSVEESGSEVLYGMS